MSKPAALIAGAGVGFSGSVARKLAAQGYDVALASRSVEKTETLAEEIGAKRYACDVQDSSDVARLFTELDRDLGPLSFAMFNPSARARGDFLDLDHADVRNALLVTAYGGFLVAQEAARRMVPQGKGAILLTGASASVKGFAKSAPFAMGKFALRGMAQSMARELHPKGVHVLHVVIDGAIRNPGRTEPADAPDSMLDPDAIADSCLALLDQPRSAWTWELEVRPWVERF
ncbi:SDR family oxidoreductase [Amorphus orientalis]|uniref:NAD(P)-dependent dehydrogenase (Short-subunit alcohol dehydrogenase family) n=1 Tax=Amorphus orientalis TaxID=649198 RepID=A0AAE4AUX0_9HYPH|nr:SDR family oxidoreductase [Amorphus orientalis]MDQ0316169.1 NAD(P)-dependent dehydrogenase (short-subunit alcohol dehydrogenase family) [Amorphus orientalis]